MSDVLIVRADARHIPLADESVQCVVTSPPYWGLRKYAGEQDSVWYPCGWDPCGKAVRCEAAGHDWAEDTQRVQIRTGLGLEKLGEQYAGGGKKYSRLAEHFFVTRGTCQWCGAWRGSYGLEPTIEMYVEHTIEILREIRRVLRSDGVVFWNVGDSYAAGKTGRSDSERNNVDGFTGSQKYKAEGFSQRKATDGLKPKDLCLIPARVAIAAQADGWWIRSMIVWSKPNPMPESVTDRPSDAYEHIIMCTRSERYYWDADAVREKGTSGPSDLRKMQEQLPRIGGKHKVLDDTLSKASAATNIGQKRSVGQPDGQRNLRNVWTFATQPYAGAHFATFPQELPRRCILAGSKPGDLILDPFGGSGTTGRVAVELNRNAVLLDIAYGTSAYGQLAAGRTTNVQRRLL